MSENKDCVLIGLPKSGKSSFVAAFWHVVESNEIKDSLTVTTLPDDRTYLEEIRERWLTCSKLDRNKVDFLKKITLNIVDKNTGAGTNFSFPDISGEMFDSQFETRKISNNFVELLENANGIMLFINPDKLQKPLQISSVDPIVEGEAAPAKKSWQHKDTPTQVILVDILQMIQPKINKRVKIAFVISAWDTILNTPDEDYNKLTPHQWIAKEMPLLEQFVETNSDIYKAKFFGLSAQGGDYTLGTDQLNKLSHQSKRIIMQDGDERNNDITRPIRWLINE